MENNRIKQECKMFFIDKCEKQDLCLIHVISLFIFWYKQMANGSVCIVELLINSGGLLSTQEAKVAFGFFRA